MSKTMTLRPRLSEKSYGQSQANNTYVLDVPGEATKHTVARAVSLQFEVSVINVNILNLKGKAKRSVSRGGRRVANGRQSDTKKAYVTLAEGQSLPFFDAAEEAEKESKDSKKAAKAKKEEKK